MVTRCGSKTGGIWLAGLVGSMLVIGPVRAQDLPEGDTGIAARYPGDQGIATDPAVLFVEDFEQPDVAAVAARWEDVKSQAGMSLSADVPAGSPGQTSLLMHKRPGDGTTGAHLYRRILPGDGTDGYQRMFARFYLKFAEDCAPLHHFGTNVGGNSPSTAWPMVSAGSRPAGDVQFWTGIEPYGDTWRWDFYTYWMEMRSYENPDGSGDECWGNSFIREGADQSWAAAGPPIPRGEWICVEMMLQVNQPVDSHSGEQAFWVDGALWRKDGQIVSHLGPGFPSGSWLRDKWSPAPGGQPFEGYRWRSASDLLANYVWAYIYTEQDDHDIQVWFDHIVVATDYIGCLASGDVPDGGQDGGEDGGQDAGQDAGPDGADAADGLDAGPDAGADSTPDAADDGPDPEGDQDDPAAVSGGCGCATGAPAPGALVFVLLCLGGAGRQLRVNWLSWLRSGGTPGIESSQSMPFFVWIDDLRTGVLELDRHHKKLVALINELHEAVTGDASPAVLMGCVNTFREYADYHFKAEEAYMRRTEHENLEAHAREHQEFALSMETWFDRLAEGDSWAGRDALQFLKKWFLDHVQHVDQAYAPKKRKR